MPLAGKIFLAGTGQMKISVDKLKWHHMPDKFVWAASFISLTAVLSYWILPHVFKQ